MIIGYHRCLVAKYPSRIESVALLRFPLTKNFKHDLFLEVVIWESIPTFCENEHWPHTSPLRYRKTAFLKEHTSAKNPQHLISLLSFTNWNIWFVVPTCSNPTQKSKKVIGNQCFFQFLGLDRNNNWNRQTWMKSPSSLWWVTFPTLINPITITAVITICWSTPNIC